MRSSIATSRHCIVSSRARSRARPCSRICCSRPCSGGVEARERFRGEATFKSFLLAIARNQLLGYYRGARRRRTFEPNVTSLQDLGTSPTGRLARGDDRRLLAQALLSIPLDMQIVLELADWEELDGAALAGVLGVSVNAAYGRLHPAKRALSAALQRLRTAPDLT